MGRRKKWFKPEKHRGWSKDQKTTTRRRRLLDSTDKRKSLHNRHLEAAKAIQALANVTKDTETEKLAKKDAGYHFKMAERHK